MVGFFVFFLIFAQKVGGGDASLLGHPYSYGPAAFISLERKHWLRYMYHFLFYTCISIPHEMLIFGDTLINMKTENRRKKFVHNLKALNKFLQSPKAKKKILPTQHCPPSPPPPKKWSIPYYSSTKQNDYVRMTFPGNSSLQCLRKAPLSMVTPNTELLVRNPMGC